MPVAKKGPDDDDDEVVDDDAFAASTYTSETQTLSKRTKPIKPRFILYGGACRGKQSWESQELFASSPLS